MAYLILLLFLIINFFLNMDYESACYVIGFFVTLKLTEFLMSKKCNPDKCPFFVHMENYDAYQKISKLKGVVK